MQRLQLIPERSQHGRVSLTLLSDRLVVLFKRFALGRQLIGLAGVVTVPLVALDRLVEGDPLCLAVDGDGDVLGSLVLGRLRTVVRIGCFGLGFRGLFRRLLRFGFSGNALVRIGGGLFGRGFRGLGIR